MAQLYKTLIQLVLVVCGPYNSDELAYNYKKKNVPPYFLSRMAWGTNSLIKGIIPSI